jgi:hypothetical protein
MLLGSADVPETVGAWIVYVSTRNPLFPFCPGAETVKGVVEMENALMYSASVDDPVPRLTFREAESFIPYAELDPVAVNWPSLRVLLAEVELLGYV